MISKYKNANKDLKAYKASKIKTGETKNHKPYTLFTICDSKKIAEDKWSNEYYTVFVFKNLNIQEKQEITFNDIEAIEVVEEEYNGVKRLKRTIFADINIVGENAPLKDITISELPTSVDLPF